MACVVRVRILRPSRTWIIRISSLLSSRCRKTMAQGVQRGALSDLGCLSSEMKDATELRTEIEQRQDGCSRRLEFANATTGPGNQAMLPIRGMEDFQRQAKTSQTGTMPWRGRLLLCPCRCTKPCGSSCGSRNRSMKHHGVRDVVCRAFGADGPYWGSILGPVECKPRAFARASHASSPPDQNGNRLFQRGRCGLMTWRPLHATRKHLALAAHIRSPGNWLACFTQAVNSASSSSSSSWMSR